MNSVRDSELLKLPRLLENPMNVRCLVVKHQMFDAETNTPTDTPKRTNLVRITHPSVMNNLYHLHHLPKEVSDYLSIHDECIVDESSVDDLLSYLSGKAGVPVEKMNL